ncbi:hypothetical protein ACHAXR_011672 [Thalassiosira sp. AJA248-18]
MSQSQQILSCPTIKANARLRRSRQWKDQSENKSPNNSNTTNAAATKGGASPKKNSRRRRRPTKKQEQLAKQQHTADDASTSTASTAPSSDESVSSIDICTLPTKKNAKSNKAQQQQRRNKRSKKQKSRPTKIVNIFPEPTPDEKSQYLALDAEMVGIGPSGLYSRLARVSLVNWDGEVVYDTLVKVEETVTDYRTFVSGITAEDLESPAAVSFDEAQSTVAALIQDKILVGHGLKNDFKVLNLSHPWYNIRDTAKYEPFMKTIDVSEATPLYPAGTLRQKKLKVLAKDKLGMMIQEEGKPHSPVEDAVAALELYKKHRGKWEKVVAYKMERTRAIEKSC